MDGIFSRVEGFFSAFSQLFSEGIWNIDPTLLGPFGFLEIRYYGVFFAVGLLLAARVLPQYFENFGLERKHAEPLTLWMPVGMLLGAHFIHLLFYETEVFYTPDKWVRFIQLGSGLASHGGGLGAVVAVWWLARRYNVDPLRYMDASMCAATWVIPWVRVGNFFNSEIVGRAWDGPWAIAFARHYERGAGYDCPGGPDTTATFAECVARHPSQVYEAVLGFAMVGLALYLQKNWRNRLRPGAILFILLGYYFTTRFLVEFVKEYQTGADLLTRGQQLSLPIVLFAAFMLFVSKKSNVLKPLAADEPASWRPPPPELQKKETAKKTKAKSSKKSDGDASKSTSKKSSAKKTSKKKRKKK